MRLADALPSRAGGPPRIRRGTRPRADHGLRRARVCAEASPSPGRLCAVLDPEVTWTQPATPEPPMSAAISRHVVRLVSEYTGRAPTQARPGIRDNFVVCITQDTMTKGERHLLDADENELLETIRREFQSTMRDDLISGVELLTGRTVLSFMSDHDAEHDCAAEVFVLDGPPEFPAVAADDAVGAD